MSDYVLAVDLGTTYSAAATCDGERTEIFDLGTESATIPSVVALRADGTVLTGEAAARRALSEPTRAAREFKRRLGDPVPIVLGGTPYGAEALTGHLLRSIVERVVEQRGESPDRVVLSHPAGDGPYKLDLLVEAARLAGLEEVEFVTEPEATAVYYSANERLEPGSLVAVYDFGGGTFDAAIVRKADSRFECLGSPTGMERFGGIDLDEAVLAHVREALGGVIEQSDATDPAVPLALGHLRDECRLAKEALSTDTDVTIPVMLPNVHSEVRLTRAELEDMIRPRLRETMAVLERAVQSAGVEFADLTSILLVGGSSRIPLVAEMVRGATHRPVVVDAHPKHAIALGAAAAGWAGATRRPEPPAVEPAPAEQVAQAEPEPRAERGPAEPEPPTERGPAWTEPPFEPSRERPWWRSLGSMVAAGVLVVLVAFAALVTLGGGDGDEQGLDEEPTGSEPPPDSDEEPIGSEPPPDPDEEPTGSEPPPDSDEEPIGSEPPPDPDEEPSRRVVVSYELGYASPDASGGWGSWAPDDRGSFEPPEDLGSDYYPLLGPYDSTDESVIEQHFAWLREAGVGIVAVSWLGPETSSDRAIPIVLDQADRHGLQVAFTLGPVDPRTPEIFLSHLEYLNESYWEHPAIARDSAPSPWSPTDEPKALIFLDSPVAVGEVAEPVAVEVWAALLDEGRRVFGLRFVASGNDPAWIDAGHFDGLAGLPNPESGYEWLTEAPPGAWFVPVLMPGRSGGRVGDPSEPIDRRSGSQYEELWRAVDELEVDLPLIAIDSFNDWDLGTQIEPASPEPPERRDVAYLTYGDVGPMGYLDITSVLIDEIVRGG